MSVFVASENLRMCVCASVGLSLQYSEKSELVTFGRCSARSVRRNEDRRTDVLLEFHSNSIGIREHIFMLSFHYTHTVTET